VSSQTPERGFLVPCFPAERRPFNLAEVGRRPASVTSLFRIRPSCTSYNRCISANRLDLPPPEGPIFTWDCPVREFECGNFSRQYSVYSSKLVYEPTAVLGRRPYVYAFLLGEFVIPFLLWHLPLVIFFGSWDVAVSVSEKGSVETHLDAQSALETPELSPFGNLAS
jgi:hypothetical protein